MPRAERTSLPDQFQQAWDRASTINSDHFITRFQWYTRSQFYSVRRAISYRGQPAVRTVARTIAVSLLRSRGLLRPQYRLRVGEIRVFYDVSRATVEILAIVAKSEAESWLAQFADPE